MNARAAGSAGANPPAAGPVLTGATAPSRAPSVAAAVQMASATSVVRLVKRHPSWLALALYSLGALITQRHAVAHLGSHAAANLPIDVTQFFWAMWWWPHAILHLDNPFVTPAMWVHDGLDMAAVTGLPLPSVLMAPVTALFGPIVSYNVVCLIASVLGAWLTYRLCLRLGAQSAPAIAGGWLFGFSSYAMSQLGGGHPNLSLTFGAPALALLVTQRLQNAISTRRLTLLTAVVVVAQLLCNPEILFMMTVFAAVAFVVGLAFTRGEMRQRAIALLPSLIAGYALAGLVASPYLYYLLTGPALSKGVDRLYYADALSYIVPTPITRIGANRFLSVSSSFFAGPVETGTYIGITGLIVFVAYAMECWFASVRARVIVVTTVVAAVLSLGITLNVAGHPTIWLPYHALVNVPGFTEALPVRLGLFVELGVAVSAALWLSRPGRPRIGRWLLVAATVALLWPNTNGLMPGPARQAIYDTAYNTPQAEFSVPAFFTDGDYRYHLRRGETILPLPFGDKGASLLWQADAHGYFRMASGYFGYIPHDYYNDPVTMELNGRLPYTDPRAGMQAFLRAHAVGAVVIEDGQGGPWPHLFRELHLREQAVDGVDIFYVAGGPS